MNIYLIWINIVQNSTSFKVNIFAHQSIYLEKMLCCRKMSETPFLNWKAHVVSSCFDGGSLLSRTCWCSWMILVNHFPWDNCYASEILAVLIEETTDLLVKSGTRFICASLGHCQSTVKQLICKTSTRFICGSLSRYVNQQFKAY